MNKIDDAWIKLHGRTMARATARFLLESLKRGKMKFPLTEESIQILKIQAGEVPAIALPKPPPPPFIANRPPLDKQSQAAGERSEEF